MLFVLVSLADAQELDEASERFYSSNALYNKRLYSLAIKEYLTFIQKFPTHARVEEARLGVALSLYAQKKWQEAEKELANVLQRRKAGDPDQLGLMLAQCMVNLKRGPDARKAFQPVTRSKNVLFKTTAMAGITESWFKEQNWKEVAAAADRLLKAAPSDALKLRGLYQGSYAQFQLEAYDKAIPWLVELVPLARGGTYESQCAFILAECYRETGDLVKATEQYKAAGAGMEGEAAAEVAYRLGLVNFRQDRYDEAIQGFKRSIELDSEGEFADPSRLLLGQSYLEKKDYRHAEHTLRSLSQVSDGTRQRKRVKTLRKGLVFSNARAALWYARVFSRQGRYDSAEGILAEAVKRFRGDPIYADLQYDYVNSLMVNEKYKEATSVLSEMLRNTGYEQRSDVLRFYAECLHRIKDYGNSVKYADEYLANHGSEQHAGDIKFLKAESLNLMGELDKALPIYEEIFTKFKNNSNAETARFRAAQIHRRKGDASKVTSLLANLHQEPPEGEAFSQVKFVAGDAAFRQKKWADALVHLQAFVDQHMGDRRKVPKEPNLDAALVQMGVCSVQLGKPEDAANYFGRMLKTFRDSPHCPLALAELGRIQYEQGKQREARGTLSLYLQSDQKKASLDAQVSYYLGWINSEEGHLPEAEKNFSDVSRKHREHELASDAAIQLGRVCMEQKKYDHAIRAYLELIQHWPSHKQMDLAVYSLGVSYARMKDWVNAAKRFALIGSQYPDSEIAADALYELAWCAKNTKKNDEAVQHYRRLIDKYPTSSLVEKVQTEMAELTFAKQDYDAVISGLRDTLAKLTKPELKEDTTYRLGTAYFNKGDYENSATTFEGFIKSYSKSSKLASAFFHAGEARMKLKETIKAREHFSAAHKYNKIENMRESIHLRLAETQRLTKEYKAAAHTYGEFIRVFPESKWLAQAHFDYGWCIEKQKDYNRAQVEYRKVIAMSKRDELAARSQFQVGECLFAMKKYDDAIRELMKVTVSYRHKKWQARAALEIGRALEAMGDNDKAIEQFQEVMKKYPNEHAIVDSARRHVSVLRHGR